MKRGIEYWSWLVMDTWYRKDHFPRIACYRLPRMRFGMVWYGKLTTAWLALPNALYLLPIGDSPAAHGGLAMYVNMKAIRPAVLPE